MKTMTKGQANSSANLLDACVHCGLCLNECPTYRLTGNEANSPRGRLQQWKAIDENRIDADQSTDFYADQCVGCLACESICPSKIEYGQLLEHYRHEQVASGRGNLDWKLTLMAKVLDKPKLLNALSFPIRLLRTTTGFPHQMIFPGKPHLFTSTSQYASQLNKRYNPTGPKVALFTGCIMESFFREVNFATVRALVKNNIRVVIPNDQVCCGAFYTHTGQGPSLNLEQKNQNALAATDCDLLLTNSSGCGLQLAKSFASTGVKIQDVSGYLGELELKKLEQKKTNHKLFVDLPCHLVHGQKVSGIPDSVLDATGYDWELAPNADHCCGAGGSYNIQQPENSREILKKKAGFLNDLPANLKITIATSNHICMMQWNMAKPMVNKSFDVKHIVQLL